ncbi:ATP-grasp domain-containing protein [Dickeya dadantii]|uniref:ATP-grasp domain-containing protein n=1 Tax=Dickeya dadantii TaxID=204038 RepID=UPI0021D96162|nr:hypothetical protein [Dickeya dadantii]
MQRAMKNAVYISLGSPHLEYPQVADALLRQGINARMIHLDDASHYDWSDVDLVNVRMCRGYHREANFLQRIEQLSQQLQLLPRPIPMANNIELIRDALDKNIYLRRLATEDHIDIIPTLWIPRHTSVCLDEIMERQHWHDVVIKPTVSSGSWQTIRVSRTGQSMTDSHFIAAHKQRNTPPYHSLITTLLQTHDICIQPFLPSILERGEFSFVFLGGQFSHAVRKTVGNHNGWWAHERLGGINYVWEPDQAERDWAEHIYYTLERRYGRLWFGRIDGIYDEHHQLRLLECELAIPRLLLQDGNWFDRYAQSMKIGLLQLS